MLFMIHIQEISIKQMNNNNFIVEKNFNLIITKFNNSRETRGHMEKMGHLAILVCSNMLSSYIQSFLCRLVIIHAPHTPLYEINRISEIQIPHITRPGPTVSEFWSCPKLDHSDFVQGCPEFTRPRYYSFVF